MELWSLALILAGGIGNFIDRVRFGYVVDFFDFRIWPIFNVADIAVCCGCGLLVFYVLIWEPRMQKKAKEA
jgi:signal peptidase II